jgi:hypothetical protein
LSPATGAHPFLAVPHDGGGSDGFEADVGVVAVDQGEEATLEHGQSLAALAGCPGSGLHLAALTPDRRRLLVLDATDTD